MTTTARHGPVVGRGPELAAVERWLSDLGSAPAGLLLTGEPGIGKSTVWSAAVASARARGATVLAARPAESELPLGFAVLGDLLVPVIDEVMPHLTRGPASALEAALLRTTPGDGPDRHAVGRAVAEAFAVIAREASLVIAVDDLHWVDAPSGRALAFAVRRLRPGVGVVATLRSESIDPLEMQDAFGDRLSDLVVSGLSVGAIHDLLRRKDESTSRREALRLHEAAGGNPFYALELGRSRGSADLPPSLRRVVEDRLGALSGPARLAVDVSAVLGPTPLPALLQFRSVDASAIDEAVRAGVVVVEDGELRFSHPLLATGALSTMLPMRRRELHREAAETSDGAENRARHIALATDGVDADAAALLEEAAGLAQARGAPESAITLIAHSARLTPSAAVDDVARRTIFRADLLYLAGSDAEALVLIDSVLGGNVTGVLRARALSHRVQHDSDSAIAVARLEEAVTAAQGDDVVQARALSSLAWMRGVWGGDIDAAGPEAQAAVDLAARTRDPAVTATALTTAGILRAFTGDVEAEGYFHKAIAIADGMEWVAGDRSPFVGFAHQRFWRADWSAADSLLATERRHATRSGEESRLERLNVFQADLEIRRGDWRQADALLDSALAWADNDYWRTRTLLWCALLKGRRGDPAALADVAAASASPSLIHDPLLDATARYVTGLVELARGQPAKAAQSLCSLPGYLRAHGLREIAILLVTPDAVEALIDSDDLDSAVALTTDLDQRAHDSDHPIGIPAAERCQGLIDLAMGDTDGALEHLANSRRGFLAAAVPYELARTLLIEGRALRRAGRRTDAGRVFTTAESLFADLGADAWALRVEQEMQASKGPQRADTDLTAAERRVARLVVAGHTNREVAAQLYTSVATVEAHLTRIYRKLQIRSRTQLTLAVADGRVRLD